MIRSKWTGNGDRGKESQEMAEKNWIIFLDASEKRRQEKWVTVEDTSCEF